MHERPRGSTWLRIGVPASAWLGYIVLGLLLFWRHVFSSDEGITLNAAWNVFRGLVPYRDFFEFYTPGTFYLFGALFRLLGPTYLVARVFAVLLLLSSGWALTQLARPFLTGWRLRAVPFLWLALFSYYPLINHNPVSLFAAVWAWLSLQVALQRRHVGAALIAGAAAGAATWMLQTKGLAVAAAAVVVLLTVSRTPKLLPPYLLGYAASLLPLLAWPIPLLWHSLVQFPLTYYQGVGDGISYFVLAIALHLLLGLGLWLKRAPSQVKSLWWLGAMLLSSTASLPDAHHIIINSFPAVPLTIWLLPRVTAWPRHAGWREWLNLLMPVLPAAYLLVLTTTVLSGLPQSVVAVARQDAGEWLRLHRQDVAALVGAIHAYVPPDEEIYSGPFLPNFYFEARRSSAIRFGHLLTSLHPPEFFAAAAADLRRSPPRLAIVNYSQVARFSYRRDNPVDQYLAEAYDVLLQHGDVTVLVRRGIPPPPPSGAGDQR